MGGTEAATRWWLQAPPRLDIAIALVAAVGLQSELWVGEHYEHSLAYPGSRVATAPFLLVVAAALAWRRLRPTVAFLIGFGALAAQSLATGGTEAGGAFLVLLVMSYSAAAYSDRAVLLVAVATTAVLIHDVRDPLVSGPVDWLFAFLFIAAGIVLGRAVHSRVERVGTLTEEAQQARAAADDRVREAVSEERARIARELHDVVAHSVSVMVVQAMAAQTADEPARAGALRVIESTGRQAMGEMRRLLFILRAGDAAPHQPQPGLGDLRRLVEDMGGTGLRVTLAEDGDPVGVPPGVGLVVFRVVQEALTNALKHGGPTSAAVEVSYGPRHIGVRVRNVIGQPTAVPAGAGHGLIGVRERVALYGGEVEAGPDGTGGYLVEVALPLAEA